MRALLLLPLAAGALVALRPAPALPPCDPDNGGLKLAPGFCATLFATLPGARQVAVAPNGDVFVAAAGRTSGLHVLRDLNKDGHADTTVKVNAVRGTGVLLTANALYWAADDRVVKFGYTAGMLAPADSGTVIVGGLPTGGHAAKTIALGKNGELFVDHGSRSNSCQQADRQPKSPGAQPCGELETRAGIWRYDANRPGQTPANGERWATGVRNGMAIAVEPTTGTLWGASHGRDNLSSNWGFSDQDNAEKPAEEFGPMAKGSDYGWPYCYYDPIAKKKVQAPEYGGDGVKTGDCGAKTQPAIAFPGHWAPMQLAFNTTAGLGAAYRGGAFLVFRGSWNRAPLPQAGHRVVFIPFAGGKAAGTYTTFAEGSATPIKMSGVTPAPDGSALYITSDVDGKIWRVVPATTR